MSTPKSIRDRMTIAVDDKKITTNIEIKVYRDTNLIHVNGRMIGVMSDGSLNWPAVAVVTAEIVAQFANRYLDETKTPGQKAAHTRKWRTAGRRSWDTRREREARGHRRTLRHSQHRMRRT